MGNAGSLGIIDSSQFMTVQKYLLMDQHTFVRNRPGQTFTGKNLKDIRNIMTAVKPEGSKQ